MTHPRPTHPPSPSVPGPAKDPVPMSPPPPPPPPPPTYVGLLVAIVREICGLAWDVATDIRTAHRERAQFQGRRA